LSEFWLLWSGVPKSALSGTLCFDESLVEDSRADR
jgi:hypothetical protein